MRWVHWQDPSPAVFMLDDGAKADKWVMFQVEIEATMIL
jgi:hypothetical protein